MYWSLVCTYVICIEVWSVHTLYVLGSDLCIQNLQTEQLTRIKELEREVMVMRGKHSDAIQQLKAHFLQEKRSFQQDSEMKIQAMAKQANQVSTLYE